jgi:hypothetical protein
MNRIARNAEIVILGSALAIPVALAQSYKINLTKNVGDLDMAVETSDGQLVVVGLENRSAQDAICTAGFNSYPSDPSPDQMVSTTVAAGQRGTLTYPVGNLNDITSNVFVTLTCNKK